MLDRRRVVALLPETGSDGATAFLRRVVRASGAPDSKFQAGCATFPEDGHNFALLVQAAMDRRVVISLNDPESIALHDTSRPPPHPSGAPSTPGVAVGPDLATIRVRIAPVSDGEVEHWRALLCRLPDVIAAEPSGFDGLAATIDVHAPSVSHLLVALQRLAGKIGAELTPTITGEVG